MAAYNKAWVALIMPAVAAIYPFLTDGFQTADIGPVIVAVLVAYGVYKVPNVEARTGTQVR